MYACKTCLCALCFTQCGEVELSELGPPMTPRLRSYNKAKLLSKKALLMTTTIKFLSCKNLKIALILPLHPPPIMQRG